MKQLSKRSKWQQENLAPLEQVIFQVSFCRPKGTENGHIFVERCPFVKKQGTGKSWSIYHLWHLWSFMDVPNFGRICHLWMMCPFKSSFINLSEVLHYSREPIFADLCMKTHRFLQAKIFGPFRVCDGRFCHVSWHSHGDHVSWWQRQGEGGKGWPNHVQ